MCAEEMRELEGRARKRPASAATSSRSGARPVTRPPAVLRNLRPAGQLRPLRLGTWCSGWESIVLAMLGMRVDFEHTFACDTSAAAQARRLLLVAHYVQICECLGGSQSGFKYHGYP